MRIKLPPSFEKLVDDIKMRIILDTNYVQFPDFFNYRTTYEDIEKFIKSYNIKYKTNIELDSERELFWKLELI